MKKYGIVLNAFGKAFVAQSMGNVRSIRYLETQDEDLPHYPIRINTNTPDAYNATWREQYDVDVVEGEGQWGFGNQTHYAWKTPFEYTLMLDCDAVPIHPAAFQPFKMLKRGWNICGSLAPARNFSRYALGVPPCFQQINCGVMFYDRTLIPLMKQWDKRYRETARHARGGCQPQFNQLLFQAGPDKYKLHTLGAEWNYRGGVQYLTHKTHIRIMHHPQCPSFIKADGTLNRPRFDAWFDSWFNKRLRTAMKGLKKDAK